VKLSSGKREISRFFVSHSFYYVYARRATPLLALNEEELDLALQLVLASGR